MDTDKRQPGELYDDLLLEVFLSSELTLYDRRKISLVCHRFRALLMPILFRRTTWSPWSINDWHPFPPPPLRPYIQIMNISGEQFRRPNAEERRSMVSQLNQALSSLVAVHTFVFDLMPGGIWPQAFLAVLSALALRSLILDEIPWAQDSSYPDDDYVFTSDMHQQRISDSAPPLVLCGFSYNAPYVYEVEQEQFMAAPLQVRRKPNQLDAETRNLRAILGPCSSGLQSLTLPGEHVLRSIDTSLDWRSLRELKLEGYWAHTDTACGVTMYSLLHALPTLRAVSLRCQESSGSTSQHAGFTIVSSDSAIQSLDYNNPFLPNIEKFELASPLQDERIISLLSPTLQQLSLVAYPVTNEHGTRIAHNNRPASGLLPVLAGVHFPAVIRLELWYTVDESEGKLLDRLPQAFPSLRNLELHRLLANSMPDSDWNPVRTFQNVLPRFKSLRIFALESPDPRTPRRTRGMTAMAKHLRKLRSVAEEMVQLTPWLCEVWMSIQYDEYVTWEEWELISEGDTTRLHAVQASFRATYYPAEINAILDGPLEHVVD
ncbi:hypothetical protein R3P38DRAFT_3381112 [Favolaschia claudopus]|uniref:F-box domain-containing protein n=1 Tax=Favolaschia claudopus TaxID=2862362 RepID=A0AAV9YZN4_9AGAR